MSPHVDGRLVSVESCTAYSVGPLPPCGGGLGRGVSTKREAMLFTPLPINARGRAFIGLPRKGGGDRGEGVV